MRGERINEKILSLTAALNSGHTPVLGDADWHELIGAIKKTGMAGYYSSLLSAHESVLKISAEDKDALKKEARRVAAHNAFYESECAALLKGLSQAGVDSVLLKGLSYMEDIYGDTSARKMSDIDLLISCNDRPDDRLKALTYLLDNGYSVYVIPSFRGSNDDFAKLTDITGEAHFIKKSGALSVNVDLHWKMRAGYPMNDYLRLDDFPWRENTGSVVIGGVTAQRLSKEMQFIHLALHFAIHHQYMGLRWFIELCLFLKRFGGELDREFIRRTAASPDCRKLLGVCLNLAADYMGEDSTLPDLRREFLPSGSLLPFEYSFYKRCLMRESRSRFTSYICMALSPATIGGRLKLVSHFMFDARGVAFWSGSEKRVPALIRPFYNFYLVGSQLLRGRQAK